MMFHYQRTRYIIIFNILLVLINIVNTINTEKYRTNDYKKAIEKFLPRLQQNVYPNRPLLRDNLNAGLEYKQHRYSLSLLKSTGIQNDRSTSMSKSVSLDRLPEIESTMVDGGSVSGSLQRHNRRHHHSYNNHRQKNSDFGVNGRSETSRTFHRTPGQQHLHLHHRNNREPTITAATRNNLSRNTINQDHATAITNYRNTYIQNPIDPEIEVSTNSPNNKSSSGRTTDLPGRRHSSLLVTKEGKEKNNSRPGKQLAEHLESNDDYDYYYEDEDDDEDEDDNNDDREPGDDGRNSYRTVSHTDEGNSEDYYYDDENNGDRNDGDDDDNDYNENNGNYGRGQKTYSMKRPQPQPMHGNAHRIAHMILPPPTTMRNLAHSRPTGKDTNNNRIRSSDDQESSANRNDQHKANSHTSTRGSSYYRPHTYYDWDHSHAFIDRSMDTESNSDMIDTKPLSRRRHAMNPVNISPTFQRSSSSSSSFPQRSNTNDNDNFFDEQFDKIATLVDDSMNYVNDEPVGREESNLETGSLNLKKWETLGTPEAVRTSFQRQRQRENPITSHIMRVANEGVCKMPKPKVIQISEASGRYIPHCTVLHRCGDDTGCCFDEWHRCIQKKFTTVKLQFYVVTANSQYQQIERTFINHTECHCVNRTRITNNCTCVDYFQKFEIEVPYEGSYNRFQKMCICDCEKENFFCQNLKQGLRTFSERDKRCIAENRCTMPECEHGSYNRMSGRCPYQQDRSRMLNRP